MPKLPKTPSNLPKTPSPRGKKAPPPVASSAPPPFVPQSYADWYRATLEKRCTP